MSSTSDLYILDFLTDQSLEASFNSDIALIRGQSDVGVHLTWTTGDAVGTFGIQITAIPADPASWITLALNPAITVAGVDGTAYIDLNDMTAPYMRITYTRTSGTGTLKAALAGKGF